MEDHNVNSFVKRSKTLSSNGKERERERESLMIYFPLNYFRIFHTYENYIILAILSERDGEKRLSKMSGENV